MDKKNANTGKPAEQQGLIIFTDLDGTLLNSSYSFEDALPALRLLKEKHIPLVICSSKTRAEIEVIRRRLGNLDPFVSENGGGIYLPKENYKSSPADLLSKSKTRGLTQISNDKYQVEETEDYYLIKLGADYTDLRKALSEIRSEGFDVKGFGDMSAEEVAELTGLKLDDAELAKEREFDETFVFGGDDADAGRLINRISEMDFNYTQGEYFHIMGDSDKGRAVEILKSIYEQSGMNVKTVALGDSPNDIEMLNKVDYPFVVKKENGTYNPRILDEVKSRLNVDGIGPEGWNRAVIELVGKFYNSEDRKS